MITNISLLPKKENQLHFRKVGFKLKTQIN